MTMHSPTEVTQMLVDWGNGDRAALNSLIPLVYEELRRLAGHYMRRENPGQTLQTSALVNEAYLRLIDQRRVRWQSRAHFFGVAAQLMRRILVDHARARARVKRGAGAQNLTFDEATVAASNRASGLVAVDDALNELAVL